MSTSTHCLTNPILPGSYPDPSICRVGDDFYMVNSSFEYFPGLPIHHSRDLVNWTLIGHALNRADQCLGATCLTDVQSDGGIHAPTIRYKDGIFYIITTNVYMPPNAPDGFNPCANFIVTATDPAGPWSEPKVIAGAPGIDPDIFFDDDGRVWYVGTHSPSDPAYPSEGEIWLQELDLSTTSLVGERHYLWRGTGGDWVEGPHLYKHKNRYYLMTAEGGTGFYHAVTVACSETITGPYRSNPRNPVLTSRHLSNDYWVNSTGHGDLVELVDGRWYMVCLGIRNNIAQRSNMGRETHLLPVIWEAENPSMPEVVWPVCAPETGKVEQSLPVPFPHAPYQSSADFYDNFAAPTLKKEWIHRRVPDIACFQLLQEKQCLRLWPKATPIENRSQSSLIGFRQTQSFFTYQVEVELSEKMADAECGIGIIQKDDHHLLLAIIRDQNDMQIVVKLNNNTIASTTVPNSLENINLVITCTASGYECGYKICAQPLHTITTLAADALVSKYYTGALCCLYGIALDDEQKSYVDFHDVRFTAK